MVFPKVPKEAPSKAAQGLFEDPDGDSSGDEPASNAANFSEHYLERASFETKRALQQQHRKQLEIGLQNIRSNLKKKSAKYGTKCPNVRPRKGPCENPKKPGQIQCSDCTRIAKQKVTRQQKQERADELAKFIGNAPEVPGARPVHNAHQNIPLHNAPQYQPAVPVPLQPLLLPPLVQPPQPLAPLVQPPQPLAPLVQPPQPLAPLVQPIQQHIAPPENQLDEEPDEEGLPEEGLDEEEDQLNRDLDAAIARAGLAPMEE